MQFISQFWLNKTDKNNSTYLVMFTEDQLCTKYCTNIHMHLHLILPKAEELCFAAPPGSGRL